VLVTLGNLKTLVPVSDVVPQGAASTAKMASPKATRAGKQRARAAVPDDREPAAARAQRELDVRGMRVDEAWPLVDKALDDASLAGLSELRVIHGRGTGQLMRGIREFLDGHPQVGSVTFAGDREGGEGVTVVKLA
jgi:DNA mismatch repair protein MutS2